MILLAAEQTITIDFIVKAEKYDERLYEVEKQIANNSTDTDAKIQDIKAEITILTKSMSAILDGLIQQGCNGSVTEAKKNLDEFLMSKL